MGYPASGAVVNLRCLAPVNSKRADIIDKRLMQLSQVADLCRPVIHLGVNVQRIIGAPWRSCLLVPNPLQIGWLCTRAGAGNKQVSAIVEQQLH
ncbi:hypothetical protein D3C80_1945940 [compost metagenome]